MLRHQLSILRKGFLVSSCAVLGLLSSTSVNAAAVISGIHGLNGGLGFNVTRYTEPSETTPSDSLLNVTNASHINAVTYGGATIIADTTLTFNQNYTLDKTIQTAEGVNLTFEGQKGKSLTLNGANFVNQEAVTFGGAGNYILDGNVSVGGTDGITKTGSGTMVQKWGENASSVTPVTVKEGTYVASGNISASQLTIQGGTAYVANGSSVNGNLTIGENAIFGIGTEGNTPKVEQTAARGLPVFQSGYSASQDTTLLNSVGVIDVNGNVRIEGRLVVNVKDGQTDIINVNGGKISLGEDFKFVIKVDSYDDYAGMLNYSILEGDFDEETMEMLEAMVEDGSIQSHIESENKGVVLSLSEKGLGVSDANMVPEPATWLLITLGAFGLGFLRKRG